MILLRNQLAYDNVDLNLGFFFLTDLISLLLYIYSCCEGFSPVVVHKLLIVVASLVVEHGL